MTIYLSIYLAITYIHMYIITDIMTYVYHWVQACDTLGMHKICYAYSIHVYIYIYIYIYVYIYTYHLVLFLLGYGQFSSKPRLTAPKGRCKCRISSVLHTWIFTDFHNFSGSWQARLLIPASHSVVPNRCAWLSAWHHALPCPLQVALFSVTSTDLWVTKCWVLLSAGWSFTSEQCILVSIYHSFLPDSISVREPALPALSVAAKLNVCHD